MEPLTSEQIMEYWKKHMGDVNLSEEDELKKLHEIKAELPFKLVYKLYLMSKFWRRTRRLVLERDKYECVKCQSKVNLHVNHKKYGKFGEENLDDLEVLCAPCHAKVTKRYDLLTNTVEFKGNAMKTPTAVSGQLFTILRRGDGKA